jgi:hypothetical protein
LNIEYLWHRSALSFIQFGYRINHAQTLRSKANCLVRLRRIGHCDLPFDYAQGGGESFDSAQDREPVERLVEPFVICYLLFVI